MSARRTEFEALEVVTFPLPAADLNPGDTWPFDMPMSVAADRSAESVSAPRVQNASCPVTGRYLGRRVRDGRGEAVVELTGSVTPPPARRGRPANAGVSGIVSGAAVVDLATGWVTVAHVE